MKLDITSYMLAMLITLNLMNCTQIDNADLILKNGKIHTVDADMTKAQAIAISDGRIIFVGSNTDVAHLVDKDTRILDLAGKTVVPGFIDSHYHFMGVGRRESSLNLDGTRSIQDFLGKVQKAVQGKEKGEWVVGRGWIEEDWPSKKYPTCSDLDRIAPDNPVILTRADGHAVVVNSQAFRVAGVDRTTADPQGGAILKDAQGNCNGILLDKAIDLVRQHVPPDTSEHIRRMLVKQGDAATLSNGITQVHDMGTDWKTIDLWKEMYAQNQLKVRIYAYIRGPGEDADTLLERGPQIGLHNDRLTVRGIKISQDGALGSRGAALLEPYSDEGTSGLLIYREEQIYPTIKRALSGGIQMAVHAIGDAANRYVLDLFDKALQEVPLASRRNTSPRFRIEHSQIVHPEDIARFKEMDIIPSMQPSHAIGDLHFAVRRLGMERMPGAYAWRHFIDQGSIIPGGSDAPVEAGNPLIEFYAATVRKDTTGFSADGWYEEYKMTREEALKSLTIWGAWAAFMEDRIGSIEPGKHADLVVLDRDLMTEPDERLFEIKILQTYVAGELVYDRRRTGQ